MTTGSSGGGQGMGGEAIAALVTSGAHLIGSAFSNFYSSRSSKRQAELAAFMADLNAKQSQRQAENALRRGEKETAQRSLAHGKLKGAQKAAIAASGIIAGEGSSGEIMAEAEIIKETDLNQIRANALAEAWGYRLQGVDFQNQATMAHTEAKSQKPALSTLSTLLTGASGIAQTWMDFHKKGALGSNNVSGSLKNSPSASIKNSYIFNRVIKV